MKKYVWEFVKRGLFFTGGGPVILAIIYAVLGATGTVTALSPWEVCRGILTISLLAFIAAGCTTLYQVERLPVFLKALIHGIVLYFTYILIYLVNGWLVNQLSAILVFTGVFITGYGLVWLIIYAVTKRSTEKLNRQLQK
ncbi:MAG: DUF3021 domain-containing protein [Ruminococcaceae bacterium]|nr:DUF3021 domain-containing protein [Oscillospiraceae bacterium]